MAPVLAGLFLFTSCEALDWGDWGEHYREDFHYTYNFNPGGRLALENSNGAVEISSWDRNSIEISGTKFASSREMLGQIKIEVSPTPDSVRVRTVIPSNNWGHGSRGASYIIHVPRRVALDEIRTSNGAIRVNDVEGAVRLRTSNGQVQVGNVKGEMELETSNGAIDVSDVSGNLRAHTSNGPIRGRLRGGSLDAGTSNGAIEVTIADAPGNWPIKADSSNGRIELNVDSGHVPDIRATTSNSSIALRLPASTNARLEADTSHGSITTDFDVTVHGGTLGKSHLAGTIGSGGPLIELSSSNGSIHVMKR
ncbi:MAG TPA: DUF4097 family beta strand repeat-containing protein [Bryobacteraceae bacterium]|nr:DUF4097 family beta strand repeat-containing protein [Bryobacteraceae bacterium]